MPSLDELAAAVHTRLETIPNATGYWGDVTPAPPTMSPLDLRVRPYWVFHPAIRRPNDLRLSGQVDARAFSFQVSAVTGDQTALPKLVDAIEARLIDWRALPGVGLCRPPLGFTPGPARADRGESPVRFFLPLQFEITN